MGIPFNPSPNLTATSDIAIRKGGGAQPVVTITLPVPADVGDHEVIGEDVTHRLAQRPGSYVVLKYVRPVVKRKADAVVCSWSVPPSLWSGSVADVSVVAG